MSVLGTIGSLATGAVKATPALLAIKKSLTKTPPKSGASLVEDTKNIPEFIGETVGDVNTGGGQTLDSNKSLQLKRAKEDNANKGYLVNLAKDMDKTIMDGIDNLNISSSLQNISLARLKATEDKKAFLNDANSSQAKAFRKNIGEDKYKLYKDLEAGYKDIKETLTYDKGLAKDYSGARGVADLPLINTIVDKVSGGKYGAYAGAIEDSTAEGVEGLTDWRYAAANLSGGALMFGGMSGVGRVGMTSGLNELGFLVKGSAGGQMIKVANTVQRMSKTSPTLYAATVDNGVTAAIQYGIDKVIGGKNSTSDFLNNLFLGAAFPVVLKGGGEVLSRSWKGLKGIVPKDVASLEKAVVAEMDINGAPDVDTAIKNIADTHKLEDGATLASKVEEYKATTTKNPDATISHEEIISTLANDGVTVTSRGGKKIANAITVLNEKLSPEQDVNGAYGTMGQNDAIQLAKQEIIAKAKETPIVNGDEADRIIDEALANNGVKKDGIGVIDDRLDDMEELIANPNSKPELIPEANNVDDLVKAIDGEGKNVSQSHIDDINGKIDTGNVSVIEDISKASETTGVKFNPERAYKKGVIGEATRQLDTAYLNKISREIELARFGYKGARDKAIKSFTDRITGIADNLRTTFGRNFESVIGKPLGKTMLRDIGTIVKGALNDTKLKGKVVSGQLNKLADSQGKVLTNVGREAARLAKGVELSLATISRQVRGDIDKISEGFPQLTKAYRKVIKDKYKAKITPSTTFEGVQKILTDVHQELFIKTAKALESKADGLIARVNKMNKKSKKSTLPVDTMEKLIETYKKFNSAKVEGDLMKMQEAVSDLDTFWKEGRDIFKENAAVTKADTKANVKEIVDTLDNEGKEMLDMRFKNSPTGGVIRERTLSEIVRDYAESIVPANLQIERIFRGSKKMVDIFLGKFQKIQTKFANQRREVVDILVPKIIKLAQRAEGDHDNASYKLSLWMTRKSEFGHENNMVTDIIFKKDKNGRYNVVFTGNDKKYLKSNKALVDSGDVVHFGSSKDDGLKEKILNDIYGEFDNLYTKDNEFKSAIDELRTHFKTTGDNIKEVSKRRFNKDWMQMEDYFPMIKKGKGGTESAFDNSGDYSVFVADTINDGHMNKRVPPAQGQMVRRELGFAEIMSSHLDGAVWWEKNIEALLDADATLRKMKQGRNGLLDDVQLKPEQDMFDMEGLAKQDVDEVSSLDNPIMTDEVAFFLRTHIGKIATRGRNLYGGVSTGRGIVNKLNQLANRIMLSGPYTALKQTASVPDIVIQAGGKNGVSGFRSANKKNIAIALEESGYLMERQATMVSKEGMGRQEFTTTGDGLIRQIGRVWGQGMDNLTGNTTKFVDGIVSQRAWLSGVSKFLDENNLFHKSGEELDLSSVRDKLMEMEGGRDLWEQAIREGDSMMSKVMGSNQLADKAIGSEDLLTKGTLLFQRTGLNHVVATFDSIINAYKSGNSIGEKAAVTAAQAAKVAIGSAFVYADFKAVEWIKNQVAIATGSKTEEETKKIYTYGGKEIVNPTYEDIVKHELMFWLTSNMISPNMGLDLTVGLSPAISQYKKVSNAPTTERAWEEAFHLVGKMTMNGAYEDALRYALSTFDVGSTTVDAKTWDTAAKQVISQYEKEGMKVVDNPNFDSMVSKQIEINKAREAKNEAEKPFKEAEAKLIKDSLQKYGKAPTMSEFIKEYKANKDGLKPITKVKEFKALYAKVQLAGAKTDGQKESILMGLTADIMYEVEIKPLVIDGDEKAAKARIKELLSKGVIKNSKGAIQMMKYLISDRDVK